MMANGYVHDLISNKYTMEQWALRCARAFGALITMRDEPTDAPIPTEIKPDSYYADRVTKVKADIEALKAMPDSVLLEQQEQVRKDSLKSTLESKARAGDENATCQAMLEKVQAWEPPTPDHQDLKSFMIKSLTEALSHNSGMYETDIESLSRPTDPSKIASVRRERLASLEHDLAYLREELR